MFLNCKCVRSVPYWLFLSLLSSMLVLILSFSPNSILFLYPLLTRAVVQPPSWPYGSDLTYAGLWYFEREMSSVFCTLSNWMSQSMTWNWREPLESLNWQHHFWTSSAVSLSQMPCSLCMKELWLIYTWRVTLVVEGWKDSGMTVPYSIICALQPPST